MSEYRSEAEVARSDLDERIRGALSAVAEHTVVPEPPTATAASRARARRSRRWRIGVGSLIVGSASVLGVGAVAASTKALPDGSVAGGSSLDDITLSVGDRATIAMFAYRNPDAASAQVVDGDGRVWPVVVGHGYLAGWLPEAAYRTGYLTARNPAGSIIQQGLVGPYPAASPTP